MLPLATSALLLVLLGLVLPRRRALQGTTLLPAWDWAVAASTAWLAASLLQTPGIDVPTPIVDRAWYLAATLALAPAVHVLGARRPGVGAWTAFVVLPMLLVLGWSAVAATSFRQTFQLETPPLLGFGLVVVMGTGNYFGTRFTAPALLYAVALFAAVLPLSTLAEAWHPAADWLRLLAAGLLTASLLLARRNVRATGRQRSPLENLWIDVRDWFGIVWAQRLMDRVNQALRDNGAPGRLDLDGFVWDEPEPGETGRRHTFDVAEQTLRWLLKRFVDPAWIDERLAKDDE